MIRHEALWIVCAYMVGSIPTGYWLGLLWKGMDVRSQGSGNLGATNVFRVLGLTAGLITLFVDILKGLIPVLISRHAFPNQLTISVCIGVAAIIGHVTSPFAGFRGGKGVATSGGVSIALLPLSSAVAIAVFLLVFSSTRIVSLSSILAILTLAISSIWWAQAPILMYMAFGIAVFVMGTHRANIKRLAAGAERPLGRNI